MERPHRTASTAHRCSAICLIRVALLFAPLVILLHPAAGTQADGPFATHASNPQIGIVEGAWLPDLACGLGVGWERLIFDWSAHQPNGPDEYLGFLNIPDEWLMAADTCDREVIAVVKGVPAWATDGLPGAGVPRGLNLPVDDPENLWANFMRQTAAYYASRGVYRFIILNEPDIAPGTYGFEFEGTLEDYYTMVRVAYHAARQGNPEAVIHLAGTTYWHDINDRDRLYTDRLLERIAADPQAPLHDFYFEALSLHIYFRTDTVYDIIRVYQDLLQQHGMGHKAIWITETNASPNLDPDWPVERPQFQITLAQQADFLVQSAAQAFAAGADRVAAYKLYDQQLPPGAESFGLLNPADANPRPAYFAWQTVARRFDHIADAQMARTERLNVVRLIHHDGRQTVIAWARTAQAVVLEVSATGSKAYVLDSVGYETLVQAVDGRHQLHLPGASCERGAEGCVVGGPVRILVQPHHQDLTLTEISVESANPITLGQVPTTLAEPGT